MYILEEDYLEHWGVLGMHWGIRKPEPDRTVILGKGESVHHISDNPNLVPHSGGMYVSYSEKDVKTYREEFGVFIQGTRSISKVFDYKFKTTKNLIAPSKKIEIKALVDLHKKDKTGDIVKRMGENKITLSWFLCIARALGHNTADKNAQNYRKLLESSNPRDQKKAFKDFSTFLVVSPENRKKYVNYLTKKGFNSMYDDFDKGQGYSENPLIIFNPTKTLKLVKKSEV